MKVMESILLAVLALGSSVSLADNRVQMKAPFSDLYVNTVSPLDATEFVVGSGKVLPSGTLVRESGEVMTAEEKERLQFLIDADMEDYLNAKVTVPANLNSGGYGSQTIKYQTIDMPSVLPMDQTVEVAYQANSHQSDSDTATLIITPLKDGEEMSDPIYETGYVNWKNYGGWFYMSTPYYTGEAVVPAGADQIYFYSRCSRASNGGTYCTAGFGEVYLHFNKDLPAIGETLQVQ